MSTVSGRELIERLQKRGRALNAQCQRLLAAAQHIRPQLLLDYLHGRGKLPVDVLHTAEVTATWTALQVDCRKYAASFVSANRGTASGGSSASDYEAYLRKVVLATVQLEPTAAPAPLAQPAASSLLTRREAGALREEGFVVLTDVLRRCGIDATRLRAEMALLHSHNVISPTDSSCNPGAHGVNLRCGTAEERAQFGRQRTPTLLAAIETLRGVNPPGLQLWPARCLCSLGPRSRPARNSCRTRCSSAGILSPARSGSPCLEPSSCLPILRVALTTSGTSIAMATTMQER